MSCNSNIFPINVDYFKEELITEILEIPFTMPKIERLLKVLVSPEVIDYKLVETEVGYSNEGQNLTGYKLVVELSIKEKLTYVAAECSQSVHSLTYESMKSIFVILPKEFNGVDMCDVVRGGRILVTPYVEAVKARALNCETIHKCLLIFVDVKIC